MESRKEENKMKKSGLLLAGGIASIVLLTHLGSVVGMAISLFILYFAIKKFLQTNKLFAKIFWGLVGFVVLMAAAANVPAILAIAAAYVLYLVYKNWNKTGSSATIVKENDPFTNFEKQWDELNKNY
jgi:lia operon protein LiaI